MKQRLGSIHLAAGVLAYFFHNPRAHPTQNSIFSMIKNEVSMNATKAVKVYHTVLAKRTEAYTRRTKQKLQPSTITFLSAIVNLELHHTLADLGPLVKYLEDTLDTKVIQVAVHQDEGYTDSDGLEHINAHAHVEMMGIDSEGRSIRKKLTRNFLSELQTVNAKLLGMKRGKKFSKRKRLDTYEYKEAMRLAEKMREDLLKKSNKVIEGKDNTINIHKKFLSNIAKLFSAEITDFTEDNMNQLYNIVQQGTMVPSGGLRFEDEGDEPSSSTGLTFPRL